MILSIFNFLYDADWCWLMLIDVTDADWCWLMLIDADWCWLVLIDADWCSNKVQPGFLLSERTSEASPVIFTITNIILIITIVIIIITIIIIIICASSKYHNEVVQCREIWTRLGLSQYDPAAWSEHASSSSFSIIRIKAIITLW